MTDLDQPARSRGLLYGRRKGKTLRPNRQQAYDAGMARFALDLSLPCTDPAALFAAPVATLALEIGFGGGEHLLHQLARQPDVGFIGCEPFVNGMARLVDDAAEHPGADRLRVYEGDARDVLAWLPVTCLSTAYLLYPDPWPKARHEKRRFIGGDTLPALARVLRPGGELRVATDIDAYKRTTLQAVRESADFALSDRDSLVPWEDWLRTRYEAKAIREGRTPSYFSLFLRNVA
ncbi:MAG: tRNA (guanine(46)-N(7))-methyltransferase TrmB [Devosiaceae bacterium]|nr:tRNA (guanine(46)-N(7))-methyltransferase TrmB [Devosiaceae bacterium MH13]